MPDVLNVDFDSATSQYTHFRVTGYSLTPRTDCQGTHVVLNCRVSMGSGSALGTHSTDQSYGRVLTGTIGGHSIGTHILKRYNLDRWVANGVYNYTVAFDIPYVTGTPYCNLVVGPQGSGSAMTTSTFNTGFNAYTVSAQSGSVPGQPTNLTVGGSAALVVAFMTGTKTLAWAAPASGGTGGVQKYTVYWSYDLSNWNYLGETTGLSYTLSLATWSSLARNGYVYFGLHAVGFYGEASEGNRPYVRLARLPSAPTSVTAPSSSKYSAPLSLSWSGAAANDGTISSYKIQARRKAAGSSDWSSWIDLATPASSPYATTPKDYTAWTVKPGDTLQYRVITVSSYGLESSTATASGEVLMKGGVMRIKVSGAWHEGIAWINVGGIWKEAMGVYQNVGGTWKEGT